MSSSTPDLARIEERKRRKACAAFPSSSTPSLFIEGVRYRLRKFLSLTGVVPLRDGNNNPLRSRTNSRRYSAASGQKVHDAMRGVSLQIFDDLTGLDLLLDQDHGTIRRQRRADVDGENFRDSHPSCSTETKTACTHFCSSLAISFSISSAESFSRRCSRFTTGDKSMKSLFHVIG